MLPIQPAIVQQSTTIRLNEVLPSIRWNAAERGPLLVVGAENIYGPRNESPLPGTPLKDLLAGFRYKLIRAGNVWVIGPESVTALSDLRGITPEKLAAQGVPLLTLFNGLGATHWKKLGSSAGLARVDLLPKLRPFFDELLPDDKPLFDPEERRSVPLSPEQRAGARLHFAWSYEWWLAPLAESEKSYRAAFAGDNLPKSELQIRREADPENSGFTLFKHVPNTPKPSDLNFSAIEGDISLEGGSSVQALIERIAQTTGLELYADARIEKHSVSILGDRARISDVLQALCLGVGGTIRQVGSAYLLTEERIPWFAQTTAHRELKERATQLSDSAHKRLSQKLEKDSPVLRAGIPALPGEPHPDTLSIQRITEYNAPDIPPAFKRRINELIEATARKRAANSDVPAAIEGIPAGLKSNGVLIDPELVFWLSLPEYGNFLDLGLDSFVTGAIKESLLSLPDPEDVAAVPAELKKPIRWPAHWAARIVRIAPKTSEEAAMQAQAARAAGFTELWLDIRMGQPQVGALVAAAAKSKLPITLVVSPLARQPGTEGDGFQSDILATGETTDNAWKRHNLNLPEGLEPEASPEPRFLFPADSVVVPVYELARIPGVKGIALLDLERPGYAPLRSEGPQEGVEGGGFIPAWRQAFVRRFHIDPADLVPAKSFGEDRKPGEGIGGQLFGEHSNDARREWTIFRSQQAQRWRQLLHTRLRVANPQARLFVRANSSVKEDTGTGFTPWPNGVALPQSNPNRPYFTEFQAESAVSPEQMRWQLNALIRDDKGTQFLCDLTQVSPLPYLKALRQPTQAKPAR